MNSIVDDLPSSLFVRWCGSCASRNPIESAVCKECGRPLVDGIESPPRYAPQHAEPLFQQFMSTPAEVFTQVGGKAEFMHIVQRLQGNAAQEPTTDTEREQLKKEDDGLKKIDAPKEFTKMFNPFIFGLFTLLNVMDKTLTHYALISVGGTFHEGGPLGAFLMSFFNMPYVEAVNLMLLITLVASTIAFCFYELHVTSTKNRCRRLVLTTAPVIVMVMVCTWNACAVLHILKI
jgi:hypothetical protein